MRVVERTAKCGNHGIVVVETAAHRFNLRLMDERLIALDVDDNVKRFADFGVSLLYAVGAALVVGRGHDGLASERLHRLIDALVVGGYINILQHLAHLLVHSLYHCFSTQHRQWLSRKACGCVAGGNDSYKIQHSHFCSLISSCKGNAKKRDRTKKT